MSVKVLTSIVVLMCVCVSEHQRSAEFILLSEMSLKGQTAETQAETVNINQRRHTD